MKAFRELLEQSELSKQQQRLCVGVLGRHLKGKPRGYGLQLWEKLRSLVCRLRVPKWVRRAQDLARWFMGLIKALFRRKRWKRPSRQRFRDYNEYLWERVKREKERVMRMRAAYEPTVEERWKRWRREREAERAWRAKQAELARERLRAGRTESYARPAG